MGLSTSTPFQRDNLSLSPSRAQEVIDTAIIAQRAANQSAGVVDISQGQKPYLFNPPVSTLVTAVGKNAGGTNAAVLTYAFNTTIYNVSQLADTPGTASTAETYNDGFGGKNINNVINGYTGMKRGLKVKYITFIATDASGNQSAVALEQMNLTFVSYNSVGGKVVTQTYDMGAALRATNYQSGMLTVDLGIIITSFNQLSWNTPSGYTITANVVWDPQG